MKILDLEIAHIRGVKNKIPIHLDGNNVVIFGPNGTGKSGIVDAVDFLFTGDISRLTGRGSRGMSLKDHGPHIDSNPEDAIIKAKVLFDRNQNPVELERHMSNPKVLIGCDKLDLNCKKALEIASKGQHVLSRSEILKFIEAESGQRSKEIQALLNLSKIEDIRATFVTINRDAARTQQTDTANFSTSVAQVKGVLSLHKFTEDAALNKINEHRTTLKGEKIEKLDVEKLKEGISPRNQKKKDRVYPEQLKNTIKSITDHIESKGQQTLESEALLRSTVKKMKEDEKLQRDLQNKRLLDLGISLLNDSGSCPLCLTDFGPGKLADLLKKRLSSANEGQQIEEKINTLSSSINIEVSTLAGHIELLTASAKKLRCEDIEKDLFSWKEILSEWSSTLKKSTDDYPVTEVSSKAGSFFIPDEWDEHLKKLDNIAEGLEKSSPEQTAWDALTAVAPVLERYFEDKSKLIKSVKFAKMTKILSDNYSQTKDRILENLYAAVNTDFTEYYKYLHKDDESDFDSELKPDGAQLDFRVDFYGRGKHHPRALHSEGHQDSMGLCLYLALNKKISEGKVGFVLLDDVVMSIDSDHRRNVCKLLSERFSDTQFIITTHNSTWARQLKSDKVVTEKNMVRFMGWSVDSGPRYRTEIDVWDDIEKKVQDAEISEAASKLREHLEYFFEMVSDSIKAKVIYKSDSRYELGDYIIGCKSKLTDLIQKAKKSAKSWGKDLSDLEQIETQVKEIIARSQAEQWGINAAVHYNSWKDFSQNDFQPIVEAFRDFEGLYKCQGCEGLLTLGMHGVTPVLLKCPCGNVSWNLEIKK
ncbi:AAA family ATPase [Desulfobacula sp.]|uniref:AAA family ATPase n=1 Tax=Desulfobacula sp. TaxID=2593537 RepID=UPI001ED44549|nr:AAA family ATPase [Desulfobacula sp.]